VGLAVCPSDACAEVRSSVHQVLQERGGSGVFRILAELILNAQGSWDAVVKRYDIRA
jgi:3-deoxy-D-manno-octulosonate 8-phosphate phosphatase (KDO 8-P phosphatase)